MVLDMENKFKAHGAKHGKHIQKPWCWTWKTNSKPMGLNMENIFKNHGAGQGKQIQSPWAKHGKDIQSPWCCFFLVLTRLRDGCCGRASSVGWSLPGCWLKAWT